MDVASSETRENERRLREISTPKVTPWKVMITFNEMLREQIVGHLANHDRRTYPLEGRRHAAVAITIVDSDPVLHDGEQPLEPEFSDMSMVPGDVEDSTVEWLGLGEQHSCSAAEHLPDSTAIPPNGRYRAVDR